MKGVYIFLADGFEETEALATLDVLRRGGIDAVTVSVTENEIVTGSHGIKVIADITRARFEAAADFSATGAKDAMVFPGGMPGTKNLAADERLMALMKQHYAQGGILAAICAAPGLVVSQLPSLEGRRFTCFDGFEEAPVAKGGEYFRAPAITDGNLITGRGPGCAIAFGLEIVRSICGPEIVEKVRHGLMIHE